MSGEIPAWLNAEHAELRELACRLREAAKGSEPARPALGKLLGSLLPLLFQHETREQQVLAAAAGRHPRGEELLLALSADHLSLRSLAKDVRLVEAHFDQYGQALLARLSRDLADTLLAHLEREERLFS